MAGLRAGHPAATRPTHMLKLWREDGLTVVFVTHSVYESAFLSTRLIVMTPRPGRVAGEIRVTAPQVRT